MTDENKTTIGMHYYKKRSRLRHFLNKIADRHKAAVKNVTGLAFILAAGYTVVSAACAGLYVLLSIDDHDIDRVIGKAEISKKMQVIQGDDCLYRNPEKVTAVYFKEKPGSNFYRVFAQMMPFISYDAGPIMDHHIGDVSYIDRAACSVIVEEYKFKSEGESLDKMTSEFNALRNSPLVERIRERGNKGTWYTKAISSEDSLDFN